LEDHVERMAFGVVRQDKDCATGAMKARTKKESGKKTSVNCCQLLFPFAKALD